MNFPQPFLDKRFREELNEGQRTCPSRPPISMKMAAMRCSMVFVCYHVVSCDSGWCPKDMMYDDTCIYDICKSLFFKISKHLCSFSFHSFVQFGCVSCILCQVHIRVAANEDCLSLFFLVTCYSWISRRQPYSRHQQAVLHCVIVTDFTSTGSSNVGLLFMTSNQK